MRLPKWLDFPEVRRWATLRCEACGHRFRWKRDARYSRSDSRAVYHAACMSAEWWQTQARECLEVLSFTLDLAGMNGADLRGAVELRAATEEERIAGADSVFRVTRALDKLREEQSDGE